MCFKMLRLEVHTTRIRAWPRLLYVASSSYLIWLTLLEPPALFACHKHVKGRSGNGNRED